ncbi:MAG: prepilin peptidase [Candidatus Methylumidiphilus alinenensis]|uniref:Prepilin leader peptidase/N-methyltransferase n=1 Tax=Candidatus Methylumidiphilus alinenensis TaxID=2202197 RepID=A0A2W4R7E5_9GAMM|nr:MAG: prepilin peptidase [Candidatus Methylumidiphilus alinenensis]
MNNLQTLLQTQNFAFFISFITVLGLVVGSFLNVVIHRLPIMLEKAWRNECEDFLELKPLNKEPQPKFNLAFPNSHCPHCQHSILPYENIPVISYLFLGGKCSQCKAKISLRYPLIEIITALVSLIVAWKFGASWQTVWGLVLSWSLICLSVIDIDVRLLPDAMVLPLIWLGLFLSLFGIYADSQSSIIGAIAGYMSLWTVFQAFKFITGKDGMGYGDFKLLALFGAWLGWQSLLLIVLLSSLVGAILGGVMIVFLKQDRSVPIPFGPYLGMAGWVAMLWGSELTDMYFRLAGIH